MKMHSYKWCHALLQGVLSVSHSNVQDIWPPQISRWGGGDSRCSRGNWRETWRSISRWLCAFRLVQDVCEITRTASGGNTGITAIPKLTETAKASFGSFYVMHAFLVKLFCHESLTPCMQCCNILSLFLVLQYTIMHVYYCNDHIFHSLPVSQILCMPFTK